MDDGDVVSSQTFTIFPEDDIMRLHTKNRASMRRLAQFPLLYILNGTLQHRPPSEESLTYYPKLTPEDGGTDWSLFLLSIVRLVRAVAPALPGRVCVVGRPDYQYLRVGSLNDPCPPAAYPLG